LVAILCVLAQALNKFTLFVDFFAQLLDAPVADTDSFVDVAAFVVVVGNPVSKLVVLAPGFERRA